MTVFKGDIILMDKKFEVDGLISDILGYDEHGRPKVDVTLILRTNHIDAAILMSFISSEYREFRKTNGGK